MKRSVRELAELIDARVMGDGTVEVSRVASFISIACFCGDRRGVRGGKHQFKAGTYLCATSAGIRSRGAFVQSSGAS